MNYAVGLGGITNVAPLFWRERMLTSKSVPKHRGRQKPKHQVFFCPLCARKLKLTAAGLACPDPICNWKE